VDRPSAEGTLVKAPKAQRGMGCGRELDLSPEFFLLFDHKMEHFGAVYLSWM